MFLNAIMLAGVGGAVVPLILHLLSRARYRNVDWGAMMFLVDAGMRQQQTARLRQWILLFLRMAIVALLAMALARPVVSAAGWGAAPTNGQSSVVIVLDCSLSMAYKPPGTNRSRFDAARDITIRLLSGLRSGDRVTVIRAGDPSAGTPGDPLPDTQRIASEIAELKPSVGAADLAESLSAAMGLLERQNGDRQLYLVCDTQASNWKSVTTDFARAWRERTRLSPVQFSIFPVGDAGENVFVESLSLTSAPVVEASTIEVDVILRNESPIARTGVAFSVRDGAADRQPPPGVVHRATVDLPPSSSKTVRFPTTFPAGEQLLTASLDTPAGLPADDQLAFVFDALPPINVLVISGDERTGPFRSESDFFRAALAPFKSAGKPGASIAAMDVLAADKWTETDLAGRQVVVLANVAELSSQQGRAIEQFVSVGGGLLIAPGSLTRVDQFNATLYRQGSGALPVQLVAAMPADAQSTSLATIDKLHPIFRFLEGRDAVSVRTSFWRHFPLAVDAPRSPSPRVLASYTSGQPFLVELPFARGRVLLLTTPIDNDWSDLPLTKFYLPFVQSMVRYLATDASTDRNVELGAELRLESIERPASGEWIVRRPDGTSETVPATSAGSGWELRYDRTTQAGVYLVEAKLAAGPIQKRFVVRSPRQESNLTALEPQRWEELEEELEFDRLEPTAAVVANVSSGGRGGRELWAMLLGGVLVLSMVELGLARWWSAAR